MTRVAHSYSGVKRASASGSINVPMIPPLWTVDSTNEEDIVGWLKVAIDNLEDDHNMEVAVQDQNRDFFSGLQSASNSSNMMTRSRDEALASAGGNPFSRVVINRIYNLIELWVAKLTRFSPNVVVNPANNEYSDRVSAKLGKLIADNIAYINNVEDLIEEVVRISRIDGETYTFVDWDQTIGDYTKEVALALKNNIKRPILSSDGKEVTDEDGKPLYDDSKPRLGDVVFNQVDSRFVILEPKQKYKEVDYLIRLKIRYVDDVKAEFPDEAADIEGGTYGAFNFPWLQLAENEVIEYHIYHKSHAKLDNGLEIRMLHDKVLSVGDYSNRSAKNQLPCVRYTCIDLPGRLHGVSLLNNLMVVQVLLNNVFSIGYTNYSLGAHAYWLVPTQANVSLDKIRNGSSVIRFTGPQGPKLETFTTLGGEFFRMLEFLDNWLVQISGHQGISQGDPPPGVDAAIAMGVLEEQENQRANPEIKKYNSVVKKLFVLALAKAQDKYKTEDGRLARIVGKNGQDTMKAIDMAKFSGSYDVRVIRSTALSESKNLRLQQLMLMKQNFPDAISDGRFLELMELADEGKFFDLATSTTRAAEAENEKFFEGDIVLDPDEHEMHVGHLDVHYHLISTLSFKEDLDQSIQQQVFDHILTHEHLAYEQAWANITLLQQLLAKPEYPRFFKLPIPLVTVAKLIEQGVTYEEAMFAKEAQLLNAGSPQPVPPPEGGGEGAPLPPEEAPPGEPMPEPMPEDSLAGEQLQPLEMASAEDVNPPPGPDFYELASNLGESMAKAFKNMPVPIVNNYVERGGGKSVGSIKTDELGNASIEINDL